MFLTRTILAILGLWNPQPDTDDVSMDQKSNDVLMLTVIMRWRMVIMIMIIKGCRIDN